MWVSVGAGFAGGICSEVNSPVNPIRTGKEEADQPLHDALDLMPPDMFGFVDSGEAQASEEGAHEIGRAAEVGGVHEQHCHA